MSLGIVLKLRLYSQVNVCGCIQHNIPLAFSSQCQKIVNCFEKHSHTKLIWIFYCPVNIQCIATTFLRNIVACATYVATAICLTHVLLFYQIHYRNFLLKLKLMHVCNDQLDTGRCAGRSLIARVKENKVCLLTSTFPFLIIAPWKKKVNCLVQ